MRSRWLPALMVCFAVLAALPLDCHAQAISGDLVGTVTDPSGAAVGGVQVTAVNQGTNTASSTASNGAGEYRISNLLPGNYTLSAEASGFSITRIKDIAVSVNRVATTNLKLEISNVSSTVQVTEAAAVLDTSTAQIQNTYSAKQAQNLPNVSIGAGVLNLSLLDAGVASSGGVGIGMGPSVGGQRPRNNNFTIDGADNNSKAVTGPQVFIPNDAVQEFSLLQNQFTAEYGHSSGGQFNTVVKSGTNQVHGMLYEYFRNRNLNALDQSFANSGIYQKPRFDQSRLGGQVGGPLLKDKWFYFADFEYNPLGQASVSGSPTFAPTEQGYSTLAALPGISLTNLGVLKQYAIAPSASAGPGVPTLSVAGQTIPVGQVPTIGPNYTNTYSGVLSSDLNISERDQLRGRYVYNRSDAINAANVSLPIFYTPVPSRNYLATLAWEHTFTTTLVNELRFAYTRQNQSFPAGTYQFPGLDQFPNLVFNDLQLQLGPNPSYPQSNISNLYQGTENLTWTRGPHTIKAGTELRKYISPTTFTQRSRGDYEYTSTNLFLFDQSPDVLAQRGLGNATFYGDQIATYSYLQDTWRVRQNLTLNLGLRYEYTTIPYSERLQSLNQVSDVPGLIEFTTPKAQKTNFAPRIGLAYSPGANGNTAIRAGFGMAYDVLFDNIGTTSLPPQFSSTADLTGVATPSGGFLGSGGILPTLTTGTLSAVQARAATSAYVPDQTLPYSINWNFDIQHVFHNDYTLQVRYVGTSGVHLPVQMQINRQARISSSAYLPTYFAPPESSALAGLPLTLGDLEAQSSTRPGFAQAGFSRIITALMPQGYSSYNGLAVQLNRRFSNGLQYQLAYTWSHTIDNSTAEFNTTSLTPRRPQDFLDLRADKASSALDHRHRVTLALMYDAPWCKSSGNWFVKNLLGNWEVDPIYTYESPEYFTVQSGIDSNLNGDSAADRTILNASGTAHTGSGVYGLERDGTVVNDLSGASAANIVAYVATNPSARYIQAGYGALANVGRNTEPTRPIDNIDLTIIKRFSIRERMHLELAGQAQNLFNHPQFIPGSINDVSVVTSAGLSPYVNSNSVNFNNPEGFFASNARVIQVVGKFIW